MYSLHIQNLIKATPNCELYSVCLLEMHTVLLMEYRVCMLKAASQYDTNRTSVGGHHPKHLSLTQEWKLFLFFVEFAYIGVASYCGAALNVDFYKKLSATDKLYKQMDIVIYTLRILVTKFFISLLKDTTASTVAASSLVSFLTSLDCVLINHVNICLYLIVKVLSRGFDVVSVLGEMRENDWGFGATVWACMGGSLRCSRCVYTCASLFYDSNIHNFY